MLALDYNNARHEDSDTVTLIVNGDFTPTGPESQGSGFFAGDDLAGWVLSSPSRRGFPVIHLRSIELMSSLSSPHSFGFWAELSGTIAQTLPTIVGRRYRLEFDTCDAHRNHLRGQIDEGASGVADVLIDGSVVQTFVTNEDQPARGHEMYFIAQHPSTHLAFRTNGRNPVGLGGVSVCEVALGLGDTAVAQFGDELLGAGAITDLLRELWK